MKASILSDQELIKAYLQGSEKAISTLIHRHKEKIFSYIFFNVKDEALAEDIFQDTFIKVINTLKRGKYNEEGKFLPWVMRIAHNLIIDHYRKSNRMPVVDGGDEFDIFDMIKNPDASIEEKIITDKILKQVKDLIKDLPKDQKEVLMMRLYYDMSFKEIADLTNVSINTALGRMRYALINLRKIIEAKNLQLTIN
ncbi:MAG: sigma-70 family RNA polymerase sigma factor [Vicingaceae bacterium]